MSKMKTKSSAKKRFRLSASGKVLMSYGRKRHNLRKRPQRMKRQARGTSVMSKQDARIVRKFLPYS